MITEKGARPYMLLGASCTAFITMIAYSFGLFTGFSSVNVIAFVLFILTVAITVWIIVFIGSLIFRRPVLTRTKKMAANTVFVVMIVIVLNVTAPIIK